MMARGSEPLAPRRDPLAEAVAILRRGGVIAFPTDTLYGLGADALNEAAVEQVFVVKGRPQGMPLPVLIADLDQISRVADPVPPLARTLAERFWPGALTLVVPRAAWVPALVGSRGWKVGVRLPDHPVPRQLARLLGGPIIGTSANRSGGPDPLTAEDVARQLGADVPCILRDGPPPGGRASTVLDITGPRPRVLRQGSISLDELTDACGVPVLVGEEGVA